MYLYECVYMLCMYMFVHMYAFFVMYVYRTHMQDLKETTDKVHYENFRQARLRQSQQQQLPPQGYVGESNI